MAADDKQDKRSFVINGDYYACPNWEMETTLRDIQAQLSEMQKQLQEIKPVTDNQTGEGEAIQVVRYEERAFQGDRIGVLLQ